MIQARAILWAQWRTVRNFYPRAGVAGTALIGAAWYGLWLLAAFAAARLVSSLANLEVIKAALPGALLIAFLYWQVVPLLMAATGASLDIRKLQAYPIPPAQLFGIEVMLRVTAAIEMLLMLLGIAAGALFNPELSKWAVPALVVYIVFNLFLAVGLRDLLTRILARKRIREIAILLMVICAGLPQLLLMRSGPLDSRVRWFFAGDSWLGWPWTSAANLVRGVEWVHSSAILLGWAAAAAVFGRWQFGRTLTFDAEAASASMETSDARHGWLENFYRLPGALFSDPLAALIEKEIRFLLRSPRFRLVFLMGFTFGLVVWLPMALGRTAGPRTFLGNNYLTVVSVYSLLLLSEVCFWNSFGFDRSAVQIYFLAPVPFARVLIGKNLSALFFILLEICAVTTVCAFLGMPFDLRRLSEAFAVAAVVSVFLLGAGNMLSIHQARAVNPATSFRAGAAGRVQAMLLMIYPIAFLPAGLAYLARWAFDSQIAFFAVLGIDMMIGLVLYRIALDSAVADAERLKEKMVADLSAGEAPIAS